MGGQCRLWWDLWWGLPRTPRQFLHFNNGHRQVGEVGEVFSFILWLCCKQPFPRGESSETIFQRSPWWLSSRDVQAVVWQCFLSVCPYVTSPSSACSQTANKHRYAEKNKLTVFGVSMLVYRGGNHQKLDLSKNRFWQFMAMLTRNMINQPQWSSTIVCCWSQEGPSFKSWFIAPIIQFIMTMIQ